MLFCPLFMQAQHALDMGAGWGNMGLSPSTTWKPYSWSEGSRKEAMAGLSYQYVGRKKIYYAPSAKLRYGNNWSMSGSVNLISLHLGVAGLGIHMLKPISTYKPEERKGKWFGTFEVNFASIGIGGNITPSMGARGAKSGSREWSDTTNQFGNQYYAFKDTYEPNNGKYSYIQYSVPLTMRFWNMLTNEVGLGFFLASNCIMLEKSFNLNSPISIGYDIQAGISLMFFSNKK